MELLRDLFFFLDSPYDMGILVVLVTAIVIGTRILREYFQEARADYSKDVVAFRRIVDS